MSLTRFFYDPFTEFERLFDDAFSSRLRPSTTSTEPSRSAETCRKTFRPKMDLIETKDGQIMATFELPGMTTDQVNVNVHDDRLTISGELQKDTETTDDSRYLMRERPYGCFARTLQLPVGIKSDQVKGHMENGILEVMFPKAAPEQETKRITIT